VVIVNLKLVEDARCGDLLLCAHEYLAIIQHRRSILDRKPLIDPRSLGSLDICNTDCDCTCTSVQCRAMASAVGNPQDDGEACLCLECGQA